MTAFNSSWPLLHLQPPLGLGVLRGPSEGWPERAGYGVPGWFADRVMVTWVGPLLSSMDGPLQECGVGESIEAKLIVSVLALINPLPFSYRTLPRGEGGVIFHI